MTQTATTATASPPMFLLVPVRRAWWPVTFAGVTEEGEIVENEIRLHFRLVDEDEAKAFFSRAGELDEKATRENLSYSQIMAEFLMEFVEDWAGVGLANKEPAKFDAENFAALLRIPNVFPAILTAYGACRRAEPATRLGN